MKEPVKKTDPGISRKSELRIRAVLVSVGIAAVLLAILFGTGTVSAASPVSGPYSVQTYATGNQVTVTINLNNMSYENVYAQAEIIANGIPIVKQNFTGSTQLSAYVTTAYSVSILDYQTHSYVFDHVYKAPSSTASAILGYEEVGGASLVIVVGMLGAFWLGKNTKSRKGSHIVNQYSEVDLNDEARSAKQIGEAGIGLTDEEKEYLEKNRPEVLRKVYDYGARLGRAVMHTIDVKPEDFLNTVKDVTKQALTIDLDEDSREETENYD